MRLAPSLSSRIFSLSEKLFSIDLRSLALVRILLSVTILTDLFLRSHDIFKFYGDGGVAPATVLERISNGFPQWTFHTWAGQPDFVVPLIFILHAVVALCVLVGYRTMLSTTLLWLFTFSLQNANPLVLYGGDVIIRLALFICIFLPWGARFSVDSALSRDTHPSNRYLSPWSAALLLQLGFVYLFASFHKVGAEWLETHTAVFFAMSAGNFARETSALLLPYPALLSFLTVAVVVFQRASFFLLFSPIYTKTFRILAMLGLMFMHACFTFFLHIGLFSAFEIAVLAVFLPSNVWDAVSRLLARRFGNVSLYYDGECGFCRSSARAIFTFLALPRSKVQEAQTNTTVLEAMRSHDSWVVVDRDGTYSYEYTAFLTLVRSSPLFFILTPFLSIPLARSIGRRVYRWVARHRSRTCPPQSSSMRQERIAQNIRESLAYAGIVYIVFVFAYNISTLPERYSISFRAPDSMEFVARLTGWRQSWMMFAPSPPRSDGWHIVRATTSDGKSIDLFRGGAPVDYTRPDHIADIYYDHRELRYMGRLDSDRGRSPVRSFLRYECRTWNASHPDNPVVEIDLVYMSSPIPPPGGLSRPPAAERISGSYDCSR